MLLRVLDRSLALRTTTRRQPLVVDHGGVFTRHRPQLQVQPRLNLGIYQPVVDVIALVFILNHLEVSQ
jgi:hypothetical protein